MQAGKAEGSEDGRGLADDRCLDHVAARENRPQPEVMLAAIIRCICDEYEVREDDLRGPARTRVLSNARRMLGWFARHFGTAAMNEVATSCHRKTSTLSRQIGKVDSGVRGNDGLPPQLRG